MQRSLLLLSPSAFPAGNEPPAQLPLICGSFTGGLICFYLFPWLRIIPAISCMAVLSLYIFRSRSSIGPASNNQRTEEKRLATFCLLFFFAGIIYAAARSEPPSALVVEEGLTDLYGKVVSVPDIRRDRIRFVIDTGELGLVRVSTPRNADVIPGDRIRAKGRIKKIRGFMNPGVPGNTERLHRAGIYYRMWSPNVEILHRGDLPFSSLFAFRNSFADRIEEDFSPHAASLLKAMILGLSDVEEDIREDFSRAGTAHILSVSGTHLSLLAAMVFLLLKTAIRLFPAGFYLRISQRFTATQLAMLFSIPMLFFYIFISGVRTPAVRALIMILCVFAALLLDRKKHWPSALSLAAMVILLWQPHALFEISFQLTFAAVIAIMLLAVPFLSDPSGKPGEESNRGRLSPGMLPGYLKGVFFVSLAAAAGTAPLTAFYFHNVSIVSPFANLIAMPFAGLALIPLGLVHCLLWLLFGASPLAPLIEVLSGAFLSMVHLFAQIPHGAYAARTPPLWWLLVFYPLLLAPVRLKVRAVMLAALVAVTAWASAADRGFELALIDVGQGEAIFVRLPDGKNMMVDTGGLRYYDVGSRIVAPFLYGRGVRGLDLVILSHAHPDHVGGLRGVSRAMSVKEVWWNGQAADNMARLKQEMTETSFLEASAGRSITGEGYSLEIIHPDRPFGGVASSRRALSRNNRSLVAKLNVHGNRFLLTGDIEVEGEEYLVRHLGRGLKAEVLKVAHHGGKSSATLEFLDAVRPDIAIISSGRDNRFRHPYETTLERLVQSGVGIYRTDIHGAVIMDEIEGELRVRTLADFRPRPWKNWLDEWQNLRLIMGLKS